MAQAGADVSEAAFEAMRRVTLPPPRLMASGQFALAPLAGVTSTTNFGAFESAAMIPVSSNLRNASAPDDSDFGDFSGAAAPPGPAASIAITSSAPPAAVVTNSGTKPSGGGAFEDLLAWSAAGSILGGVAKAPSHISPDPPPPHPSAAPVQSLAAATNASAASAGGPLSSMRMIASAAAPFMAAGAAHTALLDSALDSMLAPPPLPAAAPESDAEFGDFQAPPPLPATAPAADAEFGDFQAPPPAHMPAPSVPASLRTGHGDVFASGGGGVAGDGDWGDFYAAPAAQPGPAHRPTATSAHGKAEFSAIDAYSSAPSVALVDTFGASFAATPLAAPRRPQAVADPALTRHVDPFEAPSTSAPSSSAAQSKQGGGSGGGGIALKRTFGAPTPSTAHVPSVAAQAPPSRQSAPNRSGAAPAQAAGQGHAPHGLGSIRIAPAPAVPATQIMQHPKESAAVHAPGDIASPPVMSLSAFVSSASVTSPVSTAAPASSPASPALAALQAWAKASLAGLAELRARPPPPRGDDLAVITAISVASAVLDAGDAALLSLGKEQLSGHAAVAAAAALVPVASAAVSALISIRPTPDSRALLAAELGRARAFADDVELAQAVARSALDEVDTGTADATPPAMAKASVPVPKAAAAVLNFAVTASKATAVQAPPVLPPPAVAAPHALSGPKSSPLAPVASTLSPLDAWSTVSKGDPFALSANSSATVFPPAPSVSVPAPGPVLSQPQPPLSQPQLPLRSSIDDAFGGLVGEGDDAFGEFGSAPPLPTRPITEPPAMHSRDSLAVRGLAPDRPAPAQAPASSDDFGDFAAPPPLPHNTPTRSDPAAKPDALGRPPLPPGASAHADDEEDGFGDFGSAPPHSAAPSAPAAVAPQFAPPRHSLEVQWPAEDPPAPIPAPASVEDDFGDFAAPPPLPPPLDDSVDGHIRIAGVAIPGPLSPQPIPPTLADDGDDGFGDFDSAPLPAAAPPVLATGPPPTHPPGSLAVQWPAQDVPAPVLVPLSIDDAFGDVEVPPALPPLPHASVATTSGDASSPPKLGAVAPGTATYGSGFGDFGSSPPVAADPPAPVDAPPSESSRDSVAVRWPAPAPQAPAPAQAPALLPATEEDFGDFEAPPPLPSPLGDSDLAPAPAAVSAMQPGLLDPSLATSALLKHNDDGFGAFDAAPPPSVTSCAPSAAPAAVLSRESLAVQLPAQDPPAPADDDFGDFEVPPQPPSLDDSGVAPDLPTANEDFGDFEAPPPPDSPTARDACNGATDVASNGGGDSASAGPVPPVLVPVPPALLSLEDAFGELNLQEQEPEVTVPVPPQLEVSGQPASIPGQLPASVGTGLLGSSPSQEQRSLQLPASVDTRQLASSPWPVPPHFPAPIRQAVDALRADAASPALSSACLALLCAALRSALSAAQAAKAAAVEDDRLEDALAAKGRAAAAAQLLRGTEAEEAAVPEFMSNVGSRALAQLHLAGAPSASGLLLELALAARSTGSGTGLLALAAELAVSAEDDEAPSEPGAVAAVTADVGRTFHEMLCSSGSLPVPPRPGCPSSLADLATVSVPAALAVQRLLLLTAAAAANTGGKEAEVRPASQPLGNPRGTPQPQNGEWVAMARFVAEAAARLHEAVAGTLKAQAGLDLSSPPQAIRSCHDSRAAAGAAAAAAASQPLAKQAASLAVAANVLARIAEAASVAPGLEGGDACARALGAASVALEAAADCGSVLLVAAAATAPAAAASAAAAAAAPLAAASSQLTAATGRLRLAVTPLLDRPGRAGVDAVGAAAAAVVSPALRALVAGELKAARGWVLWGRQWLGPLGAAVSSADNGSGTQQLHSAPPTHWHWTEEQQQQQQQRWQQRPSAEACSVCLGHISQQQALAGSGTHKLQHAACHALSTRVGAARGAVASGGR